MSFSSVYIEGKKAAPDRIYYNGTVINNSLSTTQYQDDPTVAFEDQREIPLVPDSSNYEVSVQNFSLNGCTLTLPLFIPQIADPSVDVNITIYTATVSVFDGTNYLTVTKPVVWVPENQASFTPVPIPGPKQIESDYYYAYNYTHVVKLINTALKDAWTTLGGGVDFGTQCPFMEFDQFTGLFSINQDSNTTLIPYGTPLPQPYNVTSVTGVSASGGTYTAGEYSFVGMNKSLHNLFNSFTSYYNSANQLWNSQPGIFLPEVVIDTGLGVPVGVSLRTEPKTSIFQLVNPFTGGPIAKAFFARLPQDFISTGNIWSPISSFVLATTQIPVRNEAASNPITFGTANIGGQTSSSGVFKKVLVETPITAVTADVWKGFVLYEPKTDIYSSLDPSHGGISNINVFLYWRSRLTNSLIPIRVANQGSMSFRLLFKRK